jgi:hypothetical protein
MHDAAVMMITVLNRELIKDHVSIIINDGSRRLMSKQKAYTLIIKYIPKRAADINRLLNEEKSFIINIDEESITELIIDEATKKREFIEKIRQDMRITSPSILEEGRRQRALMRGQTDQPRGIALSMKSYDNAIKNMSKIGKNDFNPTEAIDDRSIGIKRRGY